MKYIKLIISLPYQLVHALRCALHKLLLACKIIRLKKLPAYTISIGNASMGGTGKTPITITLARYLAAKGLKVGVITRGYKSKTKEYPIIINSCSEVKGEGSEVKGFEASEIGDEAMEMYLNFTDQANYLECDAKVTTSNLRHITLIVDPDRYRGGLAAYEKYNCDVFILDDGLQHINLHRDCEIVLKNINESGFYREFPYFAEAKADYLIHTKVTPAWISENPSENFAEFNLSLTSILHSEDRLGVFTAIADPQSLIKQVREYLVAQGINPKNLEKIWTFPDHYFFSVGEVMEVLTLGIKIISTPKDLVKIPKVYQSKFVIAQTGVRLSPNDLLETIYQGVIQ